MSTSAEEEEELVRRAPGIPHPPYYNINRIQCVFMWLQSMPSKQQQGVKRSMLDSDSPMDVMLSSGIFAGDISTAIALGACLKPPPHIVEDGERGDFRLFFKT